MGSLATALSAVGLHYNALVMQENELEFRRRVLPENHPDIGEKRCVVWDCMFVCDVCETGRSLFNLTFYHQQAGDLHRAMVCAHEALRIWQVTLPPEHDYVVAVEELVRRLEQSM
jgi:hypothetical protein